MVGICIVNGVNKPSNEMNHNYGDFIVGFLIGSFTGFGDVMACFSDSIIMILGYQLYQ
jgi:hypothetical protein